MSDIKTLLRYDIRDYTRSGNSLSNYDNRAITFTHDGYIITHGIAYDASGIAKSIDTSLITKIANLAGGKAGSIPYQTAADTTTFLDGSTTNGYVLKYSTTSNAPYWAADNNTLYYLTLNGSAKGTENTTDLGTFYAPTTVGSNHLIILSSGSGAPSWVSLVTSLSSSEDYKVPTAYAVLSAITSALTSYFTWSGTITALPSTNLKVGNAYLNTNTTLWTIAAANSASGLEEKVDKGDIIICTDKDTPKFAVAQLNWTAADGNATLSWGSTVTLATIGGVTIDAKLPSTPVTSFNGATGALTSSYDTTNGTTSSTDGAYLIGKITLPGKNGDNNAVYELYGKDTVGTLKVGASGATADAAVSNGTDVYLTSLIGSTATNQLGFHAGNGISISASASKLLTISNTGVLSFNGKIGALTSSYTASTTSSSTNAYAIGTLTLPGDSASYTLYGLYTNTWRPVYAYTGSTTATNAYTLIRQQGISTSSLMFGPEFLAVDSNTSNSITDDTEIRICWAEIDTDGTVSYVV